MIAVDHARIENPESKNGIEIVENVGGAVVLAAAAVADDER
jgi:hypothetical protein